MIEANNSNINDKVVFVFEKGSQFNDDLFESNNFITVSKMLDTIIRLNAAQSNRIFFGGEKEDLAFFITGLIQFCNLADNLEIHQSFDYEDDEDFESDNEITIESNL
jgi:hypothetical protein